MKIKALMMAKDEDELLVPWVKHHAHIFGADNLLIFDNGTTNELALQQLDWARGLGVGVDISHPEPEAFGDKGTVLANAIQRLDNEDPADFYFPLDCDEFVGVDLDGDICFDRPSIEGALAPLCDYSGPLMIKSAYDNNPAQPDCYRPAPMQRKCFFTQGVCVWLDAGSHNGMTIDRTPEQATNLIYVHFHFRRFPALVKHSKLKIAALIPDFDPEREAEFFTPEKIQQYREEGMPCNHVFQHIESGGEDQYLGPWRAIECFPLPRFAAALQSAGANVPFSEN